MVNHIIEVLFQGVWSSLTGGWFYDPHLSLFINTVHMYAWLFLFLFPFLFYLLFESSFKIWSIYITTITILFTFIKLVNYQLNRLFDKNKIILIEDDNATKKKKQGKKKKLTKSRRKSHQQVNNTTTMIGEEAIANEDDIQDVQENDDKFNPDKIDRMEIDEWLSIQVQEDNNCEPQSNINFNEITKNSPTNRSLFKISEESLDQQIFKQQQQQHQIDQNIVSFSTIIANGPSLQDTTVSDTKLFNNDNSKRLEDATKTSKSNNETNKLKNNSKNVRRFNSDLATNAHRKTRRGHENKQLTAIGNKRHRRSSSSCSSDSHSEEEEEGRRNNTDELNAINLAKILIAKSNMENSRNTENKSKSKKKTKKKRIASTSSSTRKRAKSFNYLFKATQPPPTTSNINDESNYSSASSIVSLISPLATVGAAIAEQPSNKQETINIEDLKDSYLKTTKKSASTSFSTASSRSRTSSSSSYSSIKSSQSIKEKEEEEEEDYEKQGAKPKLRPRMKKGTNRRQSNKMIIHLKSEPEMKTNDEYDFNDTREGSVHYFVDNNNLYRYKFNKMSIGTSELVNCNDKAFNLSEIPFEFHKYLKLPASMATTTRTSRHNGLSRNRFRNDNDLMTILDEIKFKPPPVPPPLPPPKPVYDVLKIRQLDDEGESSSDWGVKGARAEEKLSDNENATRSRRGSSSNITVNIDQIISNLDLVVTQPSTSAGSFLNRHHSSSRSTSRHDQFHLRQIRSQFIRRAPSTSYQQQQQQQPERGKVVAFKTSKKTSSTVKTKYKLILTPKLSIKIPFDRRSLQAMLDNNKTVLEILFICFLAFLVSFLASYILTMDLYHDFTLIIFCFLIASCHYSMLKTCTPDSSSPTHGFNNILAFSRSIYFCLTCSAIIVLDYLINQTSVESMKGISIKLYNYELLKYDYMVRVKNFFEYFLLFQPLLFLIGLYPQINTFLITIFEQIDMNLFGGTAMQSLASAIISIVRSLVVNSVLSLILFLSILKMYGGGGNSSSIAAMAGKNKFSQSIQFSVYCSFVVLLSFLTSRQSTNYTTISNLFKKLILKIISSTTEPSSSVQTEETPQSSEQKQQTLKLEDPLPKKLEKIVKSRLESDLLTSILLFLFFFAIHASTIFSTLDRQLNDILFFIIIPFGIVNHYLIPNLRLEYPWSVFNQPFLKQKHWSQFEPSALAELCWYERIHVYINFFEKNIFHILVLLSTMTICVDSLLSKLGTIDTNGFPTCLLITILSTKLIRYSYCEPSKQYQLYLVAFLFNKFDVACGDSASAANINCLLIDLYIVSIILSKFYDFCDKLNFIFIYTAPWQLPWGSAFHAFAQPLSLPHSAFLLIQIAVSSIIGAPLMPLMGSAMFLLSYMRPIKFWEKSYNTKRIDNTNTRLQTQFDGTSVDSENLNSIFYEHLTCVLQHTLCGDIQLGRWGSVSTGDFYILSSDYLNCLVHIIEIGNGYVTFQLRGLEFKGTYCQQRELEAISEDFVDNRSCCCCKIGHLRGMLSFNTIFHTKWLAWQIIERKYIVDSYRIIDNDLSLIVNFYSLRSTLIDFYIKSSIYYLIKSTKLIPWLTNKSIKSEIDKCDLGYADYDTCFDRNLDSDYDLQLKAVTYSKFCSIYLKWIQYCSDKRFKPEPQQQQEQINEEEAIDLRKLCFLLSLACRRALITACNGSSNTSNGASAAAAAAAANASTSVAALTNQMITLSNSSGSSSSSSGVASFFGTGAAASLPTTSADPDSLQSFQHGYYTLFKGDIRIQSTKDEWLFNDIELLNSVIIKSVRMALRLHQDHFQFDQTEDSGLYDNLYRYENESIITYERDPIWRNAVLNNIPSLLALRHQLTEFSDQYKVVMLNKNFLSFRVIKINKECVRSFWAGQQHELIFLRNKNQERGSIQNAKQVLRNIINSSCDQPIGYPIYVSPLTTSYSSTHDQLGKIIGREMSFKGILEYIRNLIQRIYNNCTNNCSGSSNNTNHEDAQVINSASNVQYTARTDSCQINLNTTTNEQPQLQRLNSDQIDSSAKKATPTSTLINSLNAASGTLRSSKRSLSKEAVKQNKTTEKISITDVSQIVDLDSLSNVNKHDDLILCSKIMWGQWTPKNGMIGNVYRKHFVANGSILNSESTSNNELNSYQLYVILISNKYFIPIRSTGVECLQESTYL